MPRRQRDEERDWRATLFVWRGVLSVSDFGNSVTWRGVWVPTDTDTLPDSGDTRYENSKNDFALQTRVYRGQDELEILESCGTSDEEQFWGLEHLGDIRLTGSYQLDQNDGEGHKTYSDDWHDMMVSCRGQYAVVAACGSTEFGRFVSLGYVDGTEMVLARLGGGERVAVYRAEDVVGDLRAASCGRGGYLATVGELHHGCVGVSHVCCVGCGRLRR